MLKKLCFSCGLVCLHIFFATAQSEVFSGSWQMSFKPANSQDSIRLFLNVGAPEKGQLFPAELVLQADGFHAIYNLLLVKRNVRRLAIGRHKIPSSEYPYSLGNWPVFLNGIFDLSRDKGGLTLTAERLFTKNYGIAMNEDAGASIQEKKAAMHFRYLLKDAEIRLRKTADVPALRPVFDSIISPNLSSDYFGILGPVNMMEKNGVVDMSGNKKNSGIVSFMLNGNPVIDQNHLSINRPVEDIRLDTGMNILVMFAEEYGKLPALTGNAVLAFGGQKINMDFSEKRHTGATFIVAKLYYSPAKEEEAASKTTTSLGILKELSEADLRNDIKRFHYPNPEQKNVPANEAAKAAANLSLTRTAKPVGNLQAISREIVLALWDDAVEDGDTISLNINGHWVVQGFPVKKKPQYISVTLDPGPNKIIFIAENLGAIVPNTAILEIIDGRQRRSFMIDTDLGRNNLINITYNVKP